MRYKLRVTRAIVFILLLCAVIYLHACDRIPAGLTEHLPSLESFYENSYHDRLSSGIDDIESFWRYWSKILHDYRPRTEPIILSSNANIVRPSPEDSDMRGPETDRVENSKSDIESLGASHAGLLERLRSESISTDLFDGTGVVTVGGGEYFGPAIIGLHMLRKTGSTLPVEIFVADASEYEPSICEDYLPRFGARCLVLTNFLQGKNSTSEKFEVTHYQLKSLAMLFSSFAEVLYLDSDSIPLVDPSTELFSAEPYKSTGLVIWPDFWIATESPLFYTIAGLPVFPSNLPKTSSEAGQLLINKRTHLKTLLLANYYNLFGPDYYYPLLSQGALGQGDKETFMAAALILGEPYYRVKTGVRAVSRHDGHEEKGSGMVQYNPSDDLLYTGIQDSSRDSKEEHTEVRPAFFHSNTPKMNAGHLVDEGDLFSVDQKRLRLWGSKEDQEKLFDYDLEKAVWELLLKTGCELEHVLAEWKSRERMCKRLKEHWKEVF